MEHLLPHYEYEIGLLSRRLTEFAQRHPKIAARLGISNGADDLHVDRMMQTFALLSARIDARIEDSYPEFTESLLEVLYPEYLRTMPACAIAQFEPAALFGQLTASLGIARGTTLDANVTPCRFRTVYDVILAPLRIHSACYAPATVAPAAVRLPADVTGVISITIASATASESFDATIPRGPLCVYLSGEYALVAALSDALLIQARAAFVEVDHCGRWVALPDVPIDAAGFSEDERLLPQEATHTSDALRTLIEYFAFPEKFDFINIDLGRLRRAAITPNDTTARMLTLHIALCNTPVNSIAAQTLAGLDAAAFRLFCTPVVNLFRRDAAPIPLTSAATAYPVTPVPLQTGLPLDVYSIDYVELEDRMQSEREIAGLALRNTVPAYRALSHYQPSTVRSLYWTAIRDPDQANDASRAPLLLSLVDQGGEIAHPPQPQLHIELTATNGDLPSRMPIGAPDSDLLHEGAALTCPIRLLTRPTVPASLPRGQDALWRVLAGMAQRPFGHPEPGLKELRDFLKLHAPRTSITRRAIDAIVGLEYRPALRWMTLACQFPSFVRGVEVVVTLDESAMRGIALSLFGRVLDQFFAPYAPEINYVQLVLCSEQDRRELLRCPAQSGTHPVL